MKKTVISLMTISLFLVSCGEKKEKETKKKKAPQEKVDTTKNEELTSHTSNENINVVLISDTSTYVYVKYHDPAVYKSSFHGSIGQEINIDIEDTTVFNIASMDFEYDTDVRPIPSGGDSGVRTYHFDALKPGTTKMTITKLMQGEETLKQEMTIEVLRLQKSGGDQ